VCKSRCVKSIRYISIQIFFNFAFLSILCLINKEEFEKENNGNNISENGYILEFSREYLDKCEGKNNNDE